RSGSEISVADFTVNEGVGTANFVVSSNVAVSGSYTVNYTIRDGSARRNQDFTVPSMTGTLRFSGARGQRVNIPIRITDDAIIENTEDLTVRINSISNPLVSIVDRDARGRITDNDRRSGSGISVADFTVNEGVGTANFVVSSNV
ncbi:Calx-beta domain-containing protein, partial [Maribacter sp. 4U21]|uniref:Calx-beta domain-containing protein n=1 Tax=Maribacter sp. 4U21 TaxID=1889779 RepID=UPI001C559492